MHLPSCWSTVWTASFHNNLQFHLLFLSWLEINEVFILHHYQQVWIFTCKLQFWPPAGCPRLSKLYILGHSILLSFFIISPPRIHETLHCGILCFCARLFHPSIILGILRSTWTQSQCLVIPMNEWMESQQSFDLKIESNSRFHCNMAANTIFHSLKMRLIKNLKT